MTENIPNSPFNKDQEKIFEYLKSSMGPIIHNVDVTKVKIVSYKSKPLREDVLARIKKRYPNESIVANVSMAFDRDKHLASLIKSTLGKPIIMSRCLFLPIVWEKKSIWERFLSFFGI